MLKPQSCNAASVALPDGAGALGTSGAVREKRGAGAGCWTPSTSVKVPRCTLCGCARASFIVRTGAKHTSWPAKNSTHSSRVWTEQLGHALLQRRPLRLVHLLRGVELGPSAEDAQELGVELRLVGRDRHVVAVGRLVDAVEVRAAVEQVGAPRRPRTHLVEADEDAHQHRGAVDHRGVDHLPGTRSPALDERGEDTEDEQQPATAEVADEVDRRDRRTAGGTDVREHARRARCS